MFFGIRILYLRRECRPSGSASRSPPRPAPVPTLASPTRPLLEPPSAPTHVGFPSWKSFSTTPLGPLKTPASCLSPSQVVSQRYTSGGSPDSLPHNSSSHQLLSQQPLKCLEACFVIRCTDPPSRIYSGGTPQLALTFAPPFTFPSCSVLLSSSVLCQTRSARGVTGPPPSPSLQSLLHSQGFNQHFSSGDSD